MNPFFEAHASQRNNFINKLLSHQETLGMSILLITHDIGGDRSVYTASM